MSDDWADLTGMQRDLLAAAVEVNDGGQPTGQNIREELVESWGYDDVLPGRLYPNLDVLVEAGHVDKYALNGRTNAYEPTVEGEQAVRTRTRQTGRAVGLVVRG